MGLCALAVRWEWDGHHTDRGEELSVILPLQERYDIFSPGGMHQLISDYDLPLLGSIPLDPVGFIDVLYMYIYYTLSLPSPSPSRVSSTVVRQDTTCSRSTHQHQLLPQSWAWQHSLIMIRDDFNCMQKTSIHYSHMGRECNGIFIASQFNISSSDLELVGNYGVRASACGAPSTSSTANTLITTIDPPKNNKSLPIVLHTTYIQTVRYV